MLDALEAHLRSRLAGEVRRAEPMARHTTFRIGGPADLFVTCDTYSDVIEAVQACADAELPWTVVGRGSNLLVSDEGYRGAVLVLGHEFSTHRREAEIVKVGAACVLAYVVRDAFSAGLGGLAFAVGIPGTIGGAIAMNAGSRGVWMDSVIDSVTVFVPGSGLVRLRCSDVVWGYRTAGLPSGSIVVEAAMRLVEADKDEIQSEMEAGLKRRKATQPFRVPCAGSVFTNPTGDSAGRLIEAAGLKGLQVGGASVSDVHANFIVNKGSASARDVATLMRTIQATVRNAYGIELKPEIRLLGAFDEP